MKIRLAFVAALSLLLGPGLGWAQSASTAGVRGEYRIGPGDVLEIDVFEVDELSGPATVSAAGTIRRPLIGEVAVVGRTAVEIESELSRLYSDDLLRDPQIGVRLSELRSQPVSVLGAVFKPGVYQLQGRRRLTELLAMAGGLTPEAGETIAIARASEGVSTERELSVDVKRMLAPNASEDDNPTVLPHDAVQVAKRGVIYVTGAVERPGGFPIQDQERITLLQAISLASGLTGFANLGGARIIRESAGLKVEIPVRLDDVIKGRADDMPLEPRDVLLIPESGGKRALSRGVDVALQMATGLVIWGRR